MGDVLIGEITYQRMANCVRTRAFKERPYKQQKALPKQSFFVYRSKSKKKLSLRVLRVPFDIVNILSIVA